jgi:sugar phosphate permease
VSDLDKILDDEKVTVGKQPMTGSPVLLAMVIVLHALNHLIGGALPVLFPSIQEEFHLSYVQLGVLRSASSFSAGFPQMFVGFLRRWTSGRVLIGLGNIINSILNMFASWVGSFRQFIALRVIGSIGSSPQHPIGTSILTRNTPQSLRGRIFGLNMSIPTLASTFAPIIAAILLYSIGWRMTFFFLAVPALIASCVMIFFVKEGIEASEETKTFSLGGFLKALRNRNVLAISGVRTVMAFRMGIRAFIPLYFINELGMDTGLSSILYSIMILGGVVGPFFWGYLSDRMNRKPLIISILASQCVLFYSIQLVVDTLLLALLLFFIGFMAQTVVLQSILAESTDRSHLDHVFGFYYTLGFTLGSVSSIIFSYVIELLGFNYGFTYISIVTAISIIPSMFIKESANKSVMTL